MADEDWYKPDRPPIPARHAKPAELLFEFHVPATHTFYRVELRDHGAYGVEAQFLDPIDVRIARTFHERLDPTRTPREMAIAWAEEERAALMGDPSCRHVTIEHRMPEDGLAPKETVLMDHVSLSFPDLLRATRQHEDCAQSLR